MPTGIWFYSYVGLWLLLIFNSLVLFAVIRQVLDLHGYWVRNDPEWGLPLESLAPALPEQDAYGRRIIPPQTLGKKTMLVFVSTGCSSCKRLMSRVATYATIPDAGLVLIVTSKELQAKLYVEQYRREELFPEIPLIADGDQEVMGHYKVNAVPYVVVVDQDGRVGGKGAAVTSSEIGQLMRQADDLRERRIGRANRLQMLGEAPPVKPQREAGRLTGLVAGDAEV